MRSLVPAAGGAVLQYKRALGHLLRDGAIHARRLFLSGQRLLRWSLCRVRCANAGCTGTRVGGLLHRLVLPANLPLLPRRATLLCLLLLLLLFLLLVGLLLLLHHCSPVMQPLSALLCLRLLAWPGRR